MMRKLKNVAILAVAVGSLIGAGQVSAKTVPSYSYKPASSFVGGGPTSQGPFVSVDMLAVNDETGMVYALERSYGGQLSQFDANGTPVPFTDPSLAGKSQRDTEFLGEVPFQVFFEDNFTTGSGADLAVDNSGGPTQGNIYVGAFGGGAAIYGFLPSGAPITAKNWPMRAGFGGALGGISQPDGVAVGADSTLWLTMPPSGQGDTIIPDFISPYGTDGTESDTHEKFITARPDVVTAGIGPLVDESTARMLRRLELDSQGNIYLVAKPVRGSNGYPFGVVKYDPEGNLISDVFAGVTNAHGQYDIAIDRSNDHVFVNFGNHVRVYDKDGNQIDRFGEPVPGYLGLLDSRGIAVNSKTHVVYVANARSPQSIDVFTPGAAVAQPDVTTGSNLPTETTATTYGTVDPAGGGDTVDCRFEWGSTPTMTSSSPCRQAGVVKHDYPSNGGPQAVDTEFGPLTKGTKYFYRLTTRNASGKTQAGEIKTLRAAKAPTLSNIAVTEVNTDTTSVTVNINPNGGDTNYYVELGPDTGYGTESPLTRLYYPISQQPLAAQDVIIPLQGLTPDTTYHYRVVAENASGTAYGPDASFRTFDFDPLISDSCPNALDRQQTGAALLRDCRSYELVSAADQGGYDVSSDMTPGFAPFPASPRADDRVLYSVQDGGIPNTGKPTNRGPDAYVAVRGEEGWSTSYVGIPSDETPSTLPFGSTFAGADDALGSFAFAGPELCDPCFADGSTNIPVRLPDGGLVPGMDGSLDPGPANPAGQVGKHFSADGSHFVFGTTAQFEPLGNDNGDVTIYDRNLDTGTTQVASTLPGGATMTGPGIAQLDISEDGSRILVGKLVSTDPDTGNQYFQLYMHVGDAASSVSVAANPGGVLYNGMTSDGSMVYFTTSAPLDGTDTDTSPDLYRADVGTASATLTRVSTGTGAGDTNACNPTSLTGANNWNAAGAASADHCGIVAIGGGGGVASEAGNVYFFSPEKLDGANGTANEPNLYLAEPGSAPEFVATLEPSNPAARNGVLDSEKRRTPDFQVNPDGEAAAFATTLALTGYENRGHPMVFLHTPGEPIACVSCNPTNAPATGPSSMASYGLSLTDDGRVFFNSFDRLVLRDSNKLKDAYEWEDGELPELISTGTSSSGSSLYSVSADGRDALFYTRENLVAQDLNGPIMKIYDAREDGGFFHVPPQHLCKASDECHGPGTVPASAAPIRTYFGTPAKTDRCPTGKVRTRGKCVKKGCGKGKVRKHGKCVKKKASRAKRPNATNRSRGNR
jgi:hypothetical protein